MACELGCLKELQSSDHNWKTRLFTIYPYYGNGKESSLTATQSTSSGGIGRHAPDFKAGFGDVKRRFGSSGSGYHASHAGLQN